MDSTKSHHMFSTSTTTTIANNSETNSSTVANSVLPMQDNNKQQQQQNGNNNINNFNISSILGHLTNNTSASSAPASASHFFNNVNKEDEEIANKQTIIINSNSDEQQRTTANDISINTAAATADNQQDSSILTTNEQDNNNRKNSRHNMQRKQSVFSLDGSPMDPHNNKLLDISSAITHLTKQATNIIYNQQAENSARPKLSSSNSNYSGSDDDDDASIFPISNKQIVIGTPNTYTQHNKSDLQHLVSSTASSCIDMSYDSDRTTLVVVDNSTTNQCCDSSNKPQLRLPDDCLDCHQKAVEAVEAVELEIGDNFGPAIMNISNRKNHLLQHLNHTQQQQQQQQQQSNSDDQQQQQPMNLQHFKDLRHDCNLGSNGSSRASSCDEHQVPTSSLSSSTNSELANTEPIVDDLDSDQSTKTFTGIVGEPSLQTPQLDTIQKHLRRKSMPNPDLIGQHISNIISQNQAIVDNFNPWNKKNYPSKDSKSTHMNSTPLESSVINNSMKKRWSTSNSPRFIFGNSSLSSPIRTHKYNHSNGKDFNNQIRKLSVGKSATSRNKSSSVTSQDQFISKVVSPYNLVESKLESALRGIDHKNLDPQIFQPSKYMSMSAESNNQTADTDRQASGCKEDTASSIHQQEQISRRNECDTLSNAPNTKSSSKSERMYDSVDCLIGAQNLSTRRDINDSSDRRYSLNSYSNISNGYDMNGFDNNLLMAQNAALLKQLELQQVKLRQLSMMNQQAPYNLGETYMSPSMTSQLLENPFMAKRNLVTMNQNLGMRIHSNDSMMSNSSLESVENSPFQQNITSLYRESSAQLQNQFSIENRLKAQQERDQALIRNFLINIQNSNNNNNNNNGLPNQHLNTSMELSHLLDTSQQNLKNLPSTVGNPPSTSMVQPTFDSMSCDDEPCKDYSLTKNNYQTNIISNDRQNSDTNLNQIHVCTLCKTVFRNRDTLIAHQTHYCRLSVPSESAHKNNTLQDLASLTQRGSAREDLHMSSPKFRRNSSTLGYLTDKVRNVFVTGKDDQPVNLHLAGTLPRRDSKSISPIPLSSNINNNKIVHFNAQQSPTSPGKATSILKQQLLGPNFTPVQSLPPKKRKISEPNLKFVILPIQSS